MNSRPNEQIVQTSNAPSPECGFTLDNLEGYVLDALDRFERGVVEHHLRWCDPCQAEAARVERVVDAIPLAVPLVAAPGPGVKASLMDRIASGEAEQTVSSPTPEPVRIVESPKLLQPATSRWRYISAALIAPLALSLLVMGVWANSLRTDLHERDIALVSQIQFNQAIAGGGQVALYSVERSCPTCEGSGQLGMSESNDMGMVMGWNFDPDKRHDVWGVSREGEKMKMCELEIDSAGAVMQMFMFPEAPADLMDVYITDEHGALTYVSHLADEDDATPEDFDGLGAPIS